MVATWEIGPNLVNVDWAWAGTNPDTFRIEIQFEAGGWDAWDVTPGTFRQSSQSAAELAAGTYHFRVQALDAEEQAFDCLVVSPAVSIG